MARTLELTLSPQRFAICRLAPRAVLPAWALQGAFVSMTRTPDELSIVCEEQAVPPQVQAERGRRLFRVHGPLDFSLTGILASLAAPLAEAGVSIFAISTHDTDYLLVSELDLEAGVAALEQAGHTIHRS